MRSKHLLTVQKLHGISRRENERTKYNLQPEALGAFSFIPFMIQPKSRQNMSRCQNSGECIRSPKHGHVQHDENIEAPLDFKSSAANIDAGSRCEPEVHSPVTPESNDRSVTCPFWKTCARAYLATRSSSKSLTSSVVDFPEENGRTYHGYRPGSTAIR